MTLPLPEWLKGCKSVEVPGVFGIFAVVFPHGVLLRDTSNGGIQFVPHPPDVIIDMMHQKVQAQITTASGQAKEGGMK